MVHQDPRQDFPERLNSLNYLVTDGKHIGPTPNFFGANPARVPEGRMAGLRVLAPTDLLFEYVARTPEDVADIRMNRIEKEGKQLEYHNNQNHANHIHTVWRDLYDEWGLDLLKTHYGDAITHR